MGTERRCFCACHTHPGTYYAEPCSVCGHFNSRGRFPATIRDGWEPAPAAEGADACNEAYAIWRSSFPKRLMDSVYWPGSDEAFTAGWRAALEWRAAREAARGEGQG